MQQQPRPSPASFRKVFETTELLEMILLYLPFRDLLLAKGVHPQFRHVMEGSSKIKQALWFELQYKVGDAEINIMDSHVPDKRAETRTDLRNNTSIIQHDVHSLPEGLLSELLMNPFFNAWIRDDLCTHKYDSQYELFRHRQLSINMAALARLATTPLEASWRSMLLFQPHAAPATLTVDVNDFSEVHCMDAQKVSMRQGLRMSVLADSSIEKLGQEVRLNLYPGLMVSTKNGVEHLQDSKSPSLHA